MRESLPQEIELKLEVDPETLPRLRRMGVFRREGVGRARTTTLHSVYFDTPELSLRREGVALRVRREGRGYVQTVKTADAGRAGLFSRGEWECPVPDAHPHLEAIPDAAVRARLARCVEGSELGPMVETTVRRTHRLVVRDQARIRCDLDVGEVRTPKSTARICELELELVEGDPRHLYELALELQVAVPLRPATVGKAERGFALLTGEAPAPLRARRPQLHPNDSLDAALAAIFQSGLEQLAGNETPAWLGVDPEGVHQLRVGVRRLRSAFSLLRAYLPPEHTDPLREELRWLGRALGPARDMDVFLEERLDPIVALYPTEPALKRLHESARELRARAYDDVRRALESPRYPALVLQLGAFVASRRWRDQPLSPESARLFGPARDVAGPLLARRRRKVMRLGRHLAQRSTEERHALRIVLKKLRYATEFFGGLYPDAHAERTHRRLGRLQDELGHLNDREVARLLLDRILTHLGAEAGAAQQRSAGFVEGWSAHIGSRVETRLLERWKRFARTQAFWKT